MKKLLASLLVLTALCLTACSNCCEDDTCTDVIYNAGTQEITVDGHNGEIVVAVTFSEAAIDSITVVANEESAGIATPALTTLVDTMMAEQSAEVDSISGCTVSSDAMKNAVSQAIEAATK